MRLSRGREVRLDADVELVRPDANQTPTRARIGSGFGDLLAARRGGELDVVEGERTAEDTPRVTPAGQW